MIPGGQITAVPQPANFEPPNDRPYDPRSQTVRGGVALGDASLGRDVQNWVVTLENNAAAVKPEGGVVVYMLPLPTAQTISLAFDSNMGVTFCYQTGTGAALYYYSTDLGGYDTLTITGATSSRVCVDDYRDFYSANSDVIFAYTLNDTLYYRQQRDKYLVQYTVGSTTKLLKRMGRSESSRLQFELL